MIKQDRVVQTALPTDDLRMLHSHKARQLSAGAVSELFQSAFNHPNAVLRPQYLGSCHRSFWSCAKESCNLVPCCMLLLNMHAGNRVLPVSEKARKGFGCHVRPERGPRSSLSRWSRTCKRETPEEGIGGVIDREHPRSRWARHHGQNIGNDLKKEAKRVSWLTKCCKSIWGRHPIICSNQI